MKQDHVLNLGAGVQSTALFLLVREPDAEFRFDVAIFADTQEEPVVVSHSLQKFRGKGLDPVPQAGEYICPLTGESLGCPNCCPLNKAKK